MDFPLGHLSRRLCARTFISATVSSIAKCIVLQINNPTKAMSTVEERLTAIEGTLVTREAEVRVDGADADAVCHARAQSRTHSASLAHAT